VTIDVISIHLVHVSHKIDYPLYSSELIKYLEDLHYKMVWNHERNFVFKKALADLASSRN
jgi:type IV secretory pathway VirB6-like protein